jgi:hypothetical protein
MFGHRNGVFANAIWTVEDECIVRTKAVVTDVMPVVLRGVLMVLVTYMELKFTLRQEAGKKFPGWNEIILQFYKTYWYSIKDILNKE